MLLIDELLFWIDNFILNVSKYAIFLLKNYKNGTMLVAAVGALPPYLRHNSSH